MLTSSELVELLSELNNLRDIMKREKENNWIRGVESVIEMLKCALIGDSSKSSFIISQACNTYKSMSGGNGSFSDYHIWRDDFGERFQLNKELSKIKEKIWHLVYSQ